MKTRRDLLKGSIGLAGIIAAQKCPAFIRGLVAASNSSLIGAKAWVNPYITEGLVSMWDGEWNAGGGKRDATSRQVCNLVSGNTPWTLFGGASISPDENCIFFDRANISRSGRSMPTSCFATAYGITQWQIDIVCDPTMQNVSSDGAFIYLSGISYKWEVAWWMRPTPTLNYRIYHTDYPLVSTSGKVALSLRTSPQSSEYVQFLKNSEVSVNSKYTGLSTAGLWTIGWYTGMDRGFDMKLYTMRIYDHPLSDEETAYNYMIDKERFDLP